MSTYCEWQPDETLEDYHYRCIICGEYSKRGGRRHCGPRTKPIRAKRRKKVPLFVVRALSWLRESSVFVVLSAWRREWQIRSDGEMVRVREICRNCPDDLWDEKHQQCLDCGCCGSSKFVLLNMHAMASKKCPRGYW